jgi:hypothetical protein
MRKFYQDDQSYSRRLYHGGKRYGFFSFVFDVLMVGITCGLWLIWIFVREMRGQR